MFLVIIKVITIFCFVKSKSDAAARIVQSV